MKTDICLILEGTYPYVHGGVSSWVHQLVTSLKDLTFSIVYISSTGDVIRSPKYELPSNILEFRELFIHDFQDESGKTFGEKNEGWEAIRKLYRDMGKNSFGNMEEFYKLIIDKKTRRLNTHDLVFSKQSWEAMLELYNNVAWDESFIDFFWTMRFMHVPIVNIFNADIPDATLYHAACTGYAGLLAVIAKISRKNSSLLLTEHGIYTRERRFDISRAAWIYSEKGEAARPTRSLGFFKDVWIKKFEILSKLTYNYADKIVTLFEGNKLVQIDEGADPEKILVIPNGVDCLEGPPAREIGRARQKTVGFIGRIVSIKDIKLFIRAMKIVKEKISDVKVYIMGSSDEEPEYAQECRILVQMLQLEENIIFTGIVDVEKYYPLIDVVVLTSVSEAQPLSVLEAMSYGIPVVATNVGSCEEIVEGGSAEDRALGRAGFITNIGSPDETASAVIKILEDQELAAKMSEAGYKRVKKYYGVNEMIDSYRALYQSLLNRPVQASKVREYMHA